MEPSLEGHLEQLVRRHAELREALGGARLTGTDFAKLSKEYSELSPIVDGIDAIVRRTCADRVEVPYVTRAWIAQKRPAPPFATPAA